MNFASRLCRAVPRRERCPGTVPTAQVYARLNDDQKRKAEVAIIEKLRWERDQSVQDAMEKVVREDSH
ncbi:MAG: hypothetical protein ABSE79_01885 [Terriglobia bacterium]